MLAIESQRTPDELKNPELNYYIAFKIDLQETDKAKIELAIKSELGKVGGLIGQRRLLELKDDIIQVMCNDAVFNGATYKPNSGGRKKEADAAKAFKIKETVDVIQMLCQTRKTLFRSELLAIYNTANKFATYFTKDEFFQSIGFLSELGVKVIDNTDVKIPFVEFEGAGKLLEILRKKNLYDYLGLPSTALLSDIQFKAKELYTESQNTNDLKKKQATILLDGFIKKILIMDQQVRRSYDQYLIVKEDIWDEITQRKAFGIKEITIPEYEKYIQIAVSKLKISVDEAEQILASGCKFFQLTLIGDVLVSTHKPFNFCPYCGKNIKIQDGQKYCPFCGEKV